jgi:NAD(P)-dependent dehydrogenase (short-subunit alcohol dehydrogenase family)
MLFAYLRGTVKSTAKQALITGGAKRIGKEIALALAESGYDIALHYNSSANDAENVGQQIRQHGVKCHLYKCDLSDINQVLSLIDAVINDLPALNLLINNASVYEPAKFLESDLNSFDSNFNLHVKAPFFLSQQFALKAHDGQIINIVDADCVHIEDEYFAYLVSKKALLSFTEMAALALAPKIRVNAIAPGPILAPAGGDMEKSAQGLPMKMPGHPKYVTQAVKYLLDNDFVTGQCLFIDGGRHVKK